MASTKPRASQLGNHIRALRRQKGLSLRALARKAGVDASGLSRLESGTATHPAPHTLALLASALEVDVADLYATAGYKAPTTLPTFAPYLRAQYGLPPEAIAQLEAHFELVRAVYDGAPQRGRASEL